MPVRSLHSSVLKWPDRKIIDQKVRLWIAEEVKSHPELLRAGYFGSYARGDWGVGSDLDLIMIVSRADEPRESRSLSWDLSALPIPVDLVIYTLEEWNQLQREGGRWARTLAEETVWIYG